MMSKKIDLRFIVHYKLINNDIKETNEINY